ncbi:hypothetical protein E2C01_082522 [Portunus trituberculatus]|uniref:Uncharacterized protein n=1 Tax=Portunus trituberculatus TaxID=210409 RepID=A0A5B7ISK5_PORTR|nr:hypothetical protein [Portunus trituberculatus]
MNLLGDTMTPLGYCGVSKNPNALSRSGGHAVVTTWWAPMAEQLRGATKAGGGSNAMSVGCGGGETAGICLSPNKADDATSDCT